MPPPTQTVSQPVFIKKLRMRNFKSFEDFEISFEDINILVGVNNSGKSTILQGVISCFIFLRELIKGRDTLSEGDSRIISDLSFMNIPDLVDAWHNKKLRQGRRPLPIVFNVLFSNELEFEIHVNRYYNQPHIRLANCTRPVSNREVYEILLSLPILVPGFIGVLVSEEYKTTQAVKKVLASGRHTEVLRNVLLQLKRDDQPKFELLNSLVEKYFKVKLSKISFSDISDEHVWSLFKNREVELDISLAGSGFLQILQLLTFILTKKTNIVLLDEPDAHLHPSLQKTLIQVLADLSQKEKIQLIISTHSKEIISQTDPNNIIQVANDSNIGKRLSSYPEIVTLMNQLGTLDNIDLALLMKNKRCLFIEGNDHKILKNFAFKLGKDIFQGDNQVIAISRGGGDNYRYYDDLTIFRNFIGNDLKAYSILDRDFKNEDLITSILNKSRERGVVTHIWEKSEIENYLLVPELIERVVNEKLSRKGVSRKLTDVKNIIFECAGTLNNKVFDQYSEKLQHWKRSIGENMDTSTANQMARNFIEPKWNDWEKRISMTPGKEIISKINEKLNSDFGVIISALELSSLINSEEISKEISDVINEIKEMN